MMLSCLMASFASILADDLMVATTDVFPCTHFCVCILATNQCDYANPASVHRDVDKPSYCTEYSVKSETKLLPCLANATRHHVIQWRSASEMNCIPQHRPHSSCPNRHCQVQSIHAASRSCALDKRTMAVPGCAGTAAGHPAPCK